MRHLLDANTCIYLLNRRCRRLLVRLRSVPSADVVLCDIVKAELYYGVENSRRREQNLRDLNAFLDRFLSLPFDGQAARSYGQIRATLEARGTPIGPNDLMIAAIAVANGLMLVTNNVGEFSRVDGLDVEDWTA